MAEPIVLVWLLIEQEDGVLLARRKAEEPPFAGLWTLPGDVMLEAESASETIARVGLDQLDVRVGGEDFVDTLYVSDGGVDYVMNVFRVVLAEGRPRFRESGPYLEMIWAPRTEVGDAASYPIAEALRSMLAAGGEVVEGREP